MQFPFIAYHHLHTLTNSHSQLILTCQWAHTDSLKADKSYSHAAQTVSSAPSTTAASFPHEFISSPLREDQTSPVHYVCPHRTNWNWKCYVPLRCTPNRLALSNQACEAITNQSYESRWIWKWGVGIVGVSDRVFILGVLASWERCSITGSLIIDIFFGFVFMSHSGWGNRALADQTRRSASLARLEGSPPITKTLDAKWEQPRWRPFPTV